MLCCRSFCHSGLSVLLLLSISSAWAQNRTSNGAELLLAGEQTVTTASRKAQKVRDVIAAVTVITEEDIRRSSATSIIDLLRSVPGVDVMEPNRSQANVGIRGFNTLFANKLLVMIDGRSVYLEHFGGVLWQNLPALMSRIKRIEIVRGPGSALYGANAFSGVINIITKTPAEMAAQPEKTTFRSLVGEQRSALTELQTSFGDPKDWSFALGLAYNRTDGFGHGTPGGLPDSYAVPITTFDAQKRLKRGSLQITGSYTDAESDLSSYVFYRDASTRFTTGAITYSEDKGRAPLMVRASGYRSRTVEAGFLHGDISLYDLEIQQQRSLSSRHQLVYGGNYRSVTLLQDVTGPDHKQQNIWGLFLQDEWQIARRTTLSAGIRMDDNSLYGTNFSPRLGILHRLPGDQSLRFSYGKAFRAPRLIDSYINLTSPSFPGLTSTIVGNLNLRPERMEAFELGYRKGFRGGYAGLSVYYNRVSQLFQIVPTQFAPTPPYPAGIPTELTFINGPGAHAFGLELESEFALARGVRGYCNYAYQDVKDSTGLRLAYSPEHKINVGARAELPDGMLAALDAHFVSGYYQYAGGQTFSVPGYTRIDARLGHRIGDSKSLWSVSLLATNLFDSNHLEQPYTNTPDSPPQVNAQRRTFYLMVNGKF